MQKLGLVEQRESPGQTWTEGRRLTDTNSEYRQHVFYYQTRQEEDGRRATSTNGKFVGAMPLASFSEAFSRDSCSDTDSGICADNASDCQRSPKCSSSLSPLPVCRSIQERQPTQSQCVPLQCPLMASGSLPLVSFKLRYSRAPEEKMAIDDQSQRRARPMRVRFADEIGDANLSDCDQIDQTPPPPPPPLLPDYQLAMRRMYQGKARAASLPRRYQSPSDDRQSIRPIVSDRPSTTIDRADRRVNTAPLCAAKSLESLLIADRSQSPSELRCSLYGDRQLLNVLRSEPSISCDSLATCSNDCRTLERSGRPRFRHCMSSALQKIAVNALQRNGLDDTPVAAFPSCSSPPVPPPKPVTLTNPSPSALITHPSKKYYYIPVHPTPTSEAELAQFHNEGQPLLTDRFVDARLLSLDHRGFQTVELRKADNGPFGFYIATGTFKKKKGIFVSRINVRSLFPLLSVGDQILEINNQSLKGRTLEQIQQIMSSSNRVILRTLPAIMKTN